MILQTLLFLFPNITPDWLLRQLSVWLLVYVQTEKPLERFENRQFYKVTTTDDPVIRYVHHALHHFFHYLFSLDSFHGNITFVVISHLELLYFLSPSQLFFISFYFQFWNSAVDSENLNAVECRRRLLLENENVGTVFATDAILATLMCSPRSMYSWDIVIQKVGNKLFLDKRDASFDLLTVSYYLNCLK